MARITLAGESLIAQKQGAQQVLQIARFIYANVPWLDALAPIDRAAGKPPAGQIVHTHAIPPENTGYVNPNQVVYSSMLGSDVGDFDWNWLGLESAEGVLFAVAYVPLQQKRKNIPPSQIGNNVTRNFLVVFDGAQALTGITIDADTWQHDFTARLADIDERERLSNRDIYGEARFIGGGFKVQYGNGAWHLAPGVAYVEGVRISSTERLPIALTSFPLIIGIDVALERELSTVVARWKPTFDWKSGANYVDSNGVKHYWVGLAFFPDANTVNDWREVVEIEGAVIDHFAARKGDYPELRARSTTKDDVDLGNIPNAISDDPNTNSSGVLATTRAVYGVMSFVTEMFNRIVSGVTTVGNATRLATPRTISVTHDAVGSVNFDGSQNVSLQLTLADSGVASGTYTKVTVSSKGLVTAGEQLRAADIPVLDWSKITNGKPTTLGGYGITDAIKLGQYGLAGSSAPETAVDTIGLSGGFYAVTSQATTLANYCSVLNIPYSTGVHFAQLAFQQGGTSVRVFARSTLNAGAWNPTVELFHTGNLDPAVIVPAGTVSWHAALAAPAGYLKANGAAVSRTTFARLFAAIGTQWGAGDGVSTFNVPDLRGEFTRGWDDGRNIDPGRAFGSVQAGQNAWHTHVAYVTTDGAHIHAVNGTAASAGEHSHNLRKASAGNNTVGNYTSPSNEGGTFASTESAGAHTHSVSGVAESAGGHSHNVSIAADGGTEARPRNIALLACIKY